MIVIVVVTWQIEGHYGLALLSAASVSSTGFQGGIASYGAVANNAHKIVHLTTYHSMTRHRANICAALGGTCAHAGNIVSAINCFNAVFNVSLTLLAATFTSMGSNYMKVTGSVLSEWSQAGLVTGVVFSMLFAANTMIACLDTSKSFMRFCKESSDVQRIEKLPFPQSHIKPLKILTAYGTVTSMRMVFSPMINTLMAPLIGGFFLGINGLLFLLSGSNVLILCLSIFLINSGQSWNSARRIVLFGLLKDAEGKTIGPDSPHYQNLGVGEQIGGPFEDTTGPALNNFVKFVAVFALVTQGMYERRPDNTWMLGFLTIALGLFMIVFSKFGLTVILKCIASFLRHRQLQKAFEEGDEEDEEEEEEEDAYA